MREDIKESEESRVLGIIRGTRRKEGEVTGVERGEGNGGDQKGRRNYAEREEWGMEKIDIKSKQDESGHQAQSGDRPRKEGQAHEGIRQRP